MNFKWIVRRNIPPNKTLRNLSQLLATAKKPGHYGAQCRQVKKEIDQTESNKLVLVITTTVKTVVEQTLTLTTKILVFARLTIQTTKKTKKRFVYPPCETSGKTNHCTVICEFGAKAANILPPRNRGSIGQTQNQRQVAQSKTNETVLSAA